MAVNLEKGVRWAIAIANDDSHGYDQAHRNGPDYDCSSFVSTALYQAGFNISTSCTTRNLRAALLSIGWKSIGVKDARMRGDIFLSEGHHVVLCTSPTQIVHASINEKGTTTGGQTGDQTGREICVRSFYEHSSGWTHHFRWPGGLGSGDVELEYNWIYKKNYYDMTNEDMDNNAICLYIYLSQTYGWSMEACAGLAGNTRIESRQDPDAWEGNSYENMKRGFGLVQWTPATNYINWCGPNYYGNGNKQLDRIMYEAEKKIEYYPTSTYPQPRTLYDFTTSTLDPDYLARAWLYNYERPASYGTAADRGQWANYYYGLFASVDLSMLGRKRWPLWMYLSYHI